MSDNISDDDSSQDKSEHLVNQENITKILTVSPIKLIRQHIFAGLLCAALSGIGVFLLFAVIMKFLGHQGSVELLMRYDPKANDVFWVIVGGFIVGALLGIRQQSLIRGLGLFKMLLFLFLSISLFAVLLYGFLISAELVYSSDPLDSYIIDGNPLIVLVLIGFGVFLGVIGRLIIKAKYFPVETNG